MIATRLELDLIATGARAVELERLEEVAAEVLGEDEGAQVVQRLRRLAALQALDVPIVLLVGGATGTGKSTVATEAAHRLGITRVTSTDFIRQTIRAYFPPPTMPSRPRVELRGGRRGRRASRRASSSRRAACSSASRPRSTGRSPRAGRWRSRASTSCPGMVPTEIEGALLVHAVLHVESIEEHRSHFVVRDAATGGVRALDKYLDGLDEIRRAPGADRRARRALRRAGDREHDASRRRPAALLDLVLSRSEQIAALL